METDYKNPIRYKTLTAGQFINEVYCLNGLETVVKENYVITETLCLPVQGNLNRRFTNSNPHTLRVEAEFMIVIGNVELNTNCALRIGTNSKLVVTGKLKGSHITVAWQKQTNKVRERQIDVSQRNIVGVL